VWQALRTELHPHGVEIVTVALDAEPEQARPFIEAAKPDHPSLVDRTHLVDELFGIVNVPSAVWIDERGMIARGAGPSLITPPFSRLVREGAFEPPDLPAEVLDVVMRIDYDHELYLAGLRDWVEKGADSEWAHTPEEVVEQSAPRSSAQARAAAHFELGEHLHARGAIEAAQEHWKAAHRLDPDNWTYKRQAWHLVAPDEQGPNDVYDGYWLADVKERGPENIYPPIRP
jgi:hypothetical protein